MVMEKTLLDRCGTNLVEHAKEVGMLGKVLGGGTECGSSRFKRYMPEEAGHLIAKIFW